MSDDRRLLYLLPRPIRRLPADLAAVVGLTVATLGAVLLPVVDGTPLRIVLSIPFVLFVPGYVFLAALFPEATPTDEGDHREESILPRLGDGIDVLERATLSIGLSIAITPLLGLSLNFTPWRIRLAPIVLLVSAFVLLSTVVAAIRRRRLPQDERFSVPYRSWLAAGRRGLTAPESRADHVLNVALALSLLLATVSVGWAVAVPREGEQFTDFYLLTQQEDGDFVANDWPTDLVIGQNATIVVGLANHEGASTDYTVVVSLQRVTARNNRTLVLEERRLDRFTAVADRGGTWQEERTLRPTMTGEQLRLQFLLYKGDAPTDPRAETAYQELHLWVTVSESDS